MSDEYTLYAEDKNDYHNFTLHGRWKGGVNKASYSIVAHSSNDRRDPPELTAGEARYLCERLAGFVQRFEYHVASIKDGYRPPPEPMG